MDTDFWVYSFLDNNFIHAKSSDWNEEEDSNMIYVLVCGVISFMSVLAL